MRNYYEILDIPAFVDKNTIVTAYENKVSQLMGLSVYTREEKAKGTVRWEFTLTLLESWLEEINHSNCEEFLSLLEKKHSSFPLICAEAVHPLCELRNNRPEGQIIDSFRRTIGAIRDTITMKIARLKSLDEAYSVLTSEIRGSAYNRNLLFARTISEVTPLVFDLSALIVEMC
jgi:hypothetical protein